ncbi:MAG: glycosyltransferase family 4 protein [Acidobacteriota bacterium]
MNTTARPAIHQLSVSAAYGDAIGGEVFQIRDALRRAGYDSDVFVEFVDARMAAEVRPYQEYREVSRPGNIVLLHFSLGSKVSKLVCDLPDSLVLIYHNITPAEWFAPYTLKVARDCQRGRQELATLAGRCSLALGDSEYNRQELEALGFAPTAVLPLIMDLSRLDGAVDPLVLERFGDGRTNLLFVGRVVPNKRIEDLLRAFAYYRRYIDHRCRLVMVGEYRGFMPYYDALQKLATDLELDEVIFTGHVSQEELNAYYRVANCFICASEHEGFCVPIFEAIYRRLPVIAYSAAAIPYSTGGSVLLLADKDPAIFAETINQVLSSADLRDQLLSRQHRALQAVDLGLLLSQLLDHLTAAGLIAPSGDGRAA